MTSRGPIVGPDGLELDVTFTEAEHPRGRLVVYPCIGGTTRLYSIPHAALKRLGVSVLEFHPPAHGRSKGQMAMNSALEAFNWALERYPSPGWHLALGHSAGANALLQHSARRGARPFDWLFLVQPVFSFRDSARYMYAQGHAEELFDAVKRWVVDEERLRAELLREDWLDPAHWSQADTKHWLDEVSTGIRLGEFLEDFYLANNETSEALEPLAAKASIYLSRHDNWFDPAYTLELTAAKHVELVEIRSASDHFMTGAWSEVWNFVLLRLNKLALA